MGEEIDDWAEGRVAATRNRRRKITLIFAVLACGWLGVAGYSGQSFTCAACRMSRVDRTWLGVGWSSFEDTDCSRWYAEHVEPSHVHAWAARGRCVPYGIPGIYWAITCYSGPPITQLSQTEQIEIYQHLTNPLVAKPLFLQMGQCGGHSSPMYDALMSWSYAGYPGTWNEWWEKHHDEFEG